jgi:hypothetical protein
MIFPLILKNIFFFTQTPKNMAMDDVDTRVLPASGY